MNRKDRRAASKQGKGGGRFAPPPLQSLSPAAALGANSFAAAVAHFQAGRLPEAERACRDALMLEPNRADAMHLLGMIAFKMGHPDAACELIGRSLAQNPRNADCHLNLAQIFGTLGRLDDAVAHLRQATALKRDHAVAHALLGDVLMQQGKNAEARPTYERAVALDPRLAPAHHGLANIAMQLGRYEEAAAAFARVLGLKPDFAEAYNNLGVALASLGRWDEAAAQYERALALKPELVDVYRNLGRVLLQRGDSAGALALAWRGLVVQETDDTKAIFVYCARNPLALPDDPATRAEIGAVVTRALTEGWSRPGELAEVAAQLFKQSAAGNDCVARANKAWPARPDAHDLWGPDGLARIAGDRLLRALIESAPVVDVEVERFLTCARSALLRIASASDAATAAETDTLAFFCGLARQCFINEYVFALDADEMVLVRQLQDTLDAALASGAAICPLWPAAIAAYVPLHTLAGAPALAAQQWPEPVARLIDQQVREPLAEHAIRSTIPALTAIADDVSLAVQRQYEEMPYPRVIRTGAIGRPTTLEWYVRNQFPHAPIQDLGPCSPLEVLIAGCGTDQHAIESARRFVGARVLAIDLSRASIAHAMRRTRESGLRNIEYAQADILNLGGLGRTFDLVEASGVLHHLRDPAEGWRVLLSLLRPGGVMRIGLYSAIARADVRAARAFIAERGYAPTTDGIRQCRQDILGLPDGAPPKNVARFPDFFTTSECRDLVFHVQEHQFTIPQIAGFLRDHALTFIGFTGVMPHGYRARFPADAAMADLDQWHQLETEEPATFAGMYQFWVQKRAA